MKRKTTLILSIIELVLGALGLLSFGVLSFSGESMRGSIPALILSIFLVVFNLIRIFQYMRERENKSQMMDGEKVRIIKIGKEALFELIYEHFNDHQDVYLDVDPLQVMNYWDIDFENGQFIYCAVKFEEDESGNPIGLPETIDVSKIMKKIPDTTTTMYQPNRYKEYTKQELEELSK